MTPNEHMQLVTDAFERWTGGDFRGACELFTPDATWYTQTRYLPAEAYTGREAIEDMLRELATHTELSMDFSRMEAVGDKVLVHVYARTMDDDAPNDDWFQLYSFRDGGIAKVEPHDNRDDAAAAAAPQA